MPSGTNTSLSRVDSASAILPVLKPQLPASLAVILDKEPYPGMPLPTMPAVWIDRNREILQASLRTLHRGLSPAPERFIRETLAKLAILKATAKMTTGEWRIRGDEYVRLLGHYPADIWQDAADEYAVESKWFPDASELNAIMRPRLQQRWKHIRRLEALLNGSRQASSVPMPAEHRRKMARGMRQLAEALRHI